MIGWSRSLCRHHAKFSKPVAERRLHVCARPKVVHTPDPCCFRAGPELGPLASLMVAPEEGSWRVDEVTVSSSRSRHTDRFVCRDALGAAGQSAGYLSPLPQDAVVYGSGESAVILTRVRPLSLLTGMDADGCLIRSKGASWQSSGVLASSLPRAFIRRGSCVLSDRYHRCRSRRPRCMQ